MPGDRLQVLRFLSQLREAVPDAERVFTQGGCFRLFLLLREVWPQAVAWYDGDHVITEVGGRFFDITGQARKGRHYPMTAEPAQLKNAFRWSAKR